MTLRERLDEYVIKNTPGGRLNLSGAEAFARAELLKAAEIAKEMSCPNCNHRECGIVRNYAERIRKLAE